MNLADVRVTFGELLTLGSLVLGLAWQNATLVARHNELERRVGAVQRAVEQLLGRPVLVHVRERDEEP